MATEVGTTENGSVTFALADLLANDFDDDGRCGPRARIGQPANGAVTVNLVGGDARSAGGAGAGRRRCVVGDACRRLGAAGLDDRQRGHRPADRDGAARHPWRFRHLRFTRTVGGVAETAALVHRFDGNDGVTLSYMPQSGLLRATTASPMSITDDARAPASAAVTVHVAPIVRPAHRGQGHGSTASRIRRWSSIRRYSARQRLRRRRRSDPLPRRAQRRRTARSSSTAPSIIFTPDHNFDGGATFEYQRDRRHPRHQHRPGRDRRRARPTAPRSRSTDVFTPSRTRRSSSPSPICSSTTAIRTGDDDPLRLARGATIRTAASSSCRAAATSSCPTRTSTGRSRSAIRSPTAACTRTARSRFDVAAVNDAPIANPTADGNIRGFTGDQDQPLVIDFADLIANDRDVEGDGFTLVEVFDGDNGDVVQVGDTAVFTPRAGYYGDAGFHYRVTDVHGATSVGYVSLTILPEFDLPIAVSDAGFEVLEDGYIDIDPAALMANDYAPEGTTLTFLGLDRRPAARQRPLPRHAGRRFLRQARADLHDQQRRRLPRPDHGDDQRPAGQRRAGGGRRQPATRRKTRRSPSSPPSCSPTISTSTGRRSS